MEIRNIDIFDYDVQDIYTLEPRGGRRVATRQTRPDRIYRVWDWANRVWVVIGLTRLTRLLNGLGRPEPALSLIHI